MVYAATKQVIKEIQEITATQAAMIVEPNAAGFRDYIATGSAASEAKANRADLLRLPIITKAIMIILATLKSSWLNRIRTIICGMLITLYLIAWC